MATNGLNRITEKILAAANEQANEVLAAAQADCDRILSGYEEKAAAIRAANEREIEQKTKDLLARAGSSAAMEGRNLVGEARSELIETVFRSAFEEIEKKPQAEYAELIVGLLSAAAVELFTTEEKNLKLYGAEEEAVAEKCEILLNPADRSAIGKTVLEGVLKTLSGKISAANLKRSPSPRIPSTFAAVPFCGMVRWSPTVPLKCSFRCCGAIWKPMSAASFSPRNRLDGKGGKRWNTICSPARVSASWKTD